MGLLKKNLTFTIIVVICLLAFGAGAYLAFAESGKIDQAKSKITSAESQLNNMRFADPAPSEENVAASRQNVEQLVAELNKIRDNLERGSRITASSDGIGVMAGVQQFISDYRRKAAAHVDENDIESPIELPENFGFGFERYVDNASPLEDESKIQALDKQRQILSYLLDRLIAADPESIVSVRREVLEQSGQAQGRDQSQSFSISPAVSARVPGAVETMGFSLSFTGYTDSLREFLNSLAKFDLPIVVRSIEVARPTGQTAKTNAGKKGNDLDAIFGVFGGSSNSAAESAAPEETKKLVISENTSTFTVVLEFIEIVLPADSAEDNI
ncbi:Amuc_1100 family pilus-like protein [Coraliomargarita sp. SDUM461004]|uniref:Amuc_1100 family pilus-like protein n=1 Tax=Thalassobacterium sedimentorum TaxID=3041258 RepID=A0ABU1AHX1_9BACT|nr:Amuc_1100 family pilus-like protein [Coraliomargarita sp. SDUM461004]MDQ8194417.1 Amuc_1100 family pilus-like protein [Coraliomargarita sp. SDUM461004]